MSSQEEIYTSVVNKLSETGYSRASELWKEWRQYVIDSWGTEDDFQIYDYIGLDGKPVREVYIEVLTYDLGFTKEHCYPEDVVDEATEEELDCYDSMGCIEVADAIERGIQKFVDEHYA